MRTRSRLLLAFVTMHALLILAGAAVAWWWIDASWRNHAEARAEAIGGLATFATTAQVRERMEAISGYRIVPVGEMSDQVPVGAIRVDDAMGRSYDIFYRTEAYHAGRRWVLWAAALFVVAGTVLALPLAWVLAGLASRPVERLALAARGLGEDIERPIIGEGAGELLVLAAALEQARQRLLELDRQHRQDERLATLGTFTAVIAHEIRNPLSAVALTIDLLARQPDADPALASLRPELRRLDLIIDELLAYSRGITARLEPCDLHEQAAEVLRLLDRQARHAQVVLRQEGHATVQADPQRIRQLLLNLVLNAIQAQHGGGEVRVCICPDGLVVEDDGPGLPPAVADAAFDPFVSGRPEGTGLGLHIAREIAHAHGATLELQRHRSGAGFVLAGLAPVDA